MFFKKLIETEFKLPCNYEELSQQDRRLVREEYIHRQHGYCYCCETRLDGEPSFDIAEIEVNPDLFPENFFNYPVHLHHNHETGMTIGAVHAHCNAYLWEHCDE